MSKVEEQTASEKLKLMIEDQIGELFAYRPTESEISTRAVNGVHSIIQYCKQELETMGYDVTVEIKIVKK